MSNGTEIQLEVESKKKVDKNPDSPEDTAVFKYSLRATNTDIFESVKIKANEDFAMEEDTFSFRELIAQKDLEEVVNENE